VVESGADENRPGLRRLVDDLRQRSRTWNTVLLLDTSRLARRPIIAVMFERDAERNGVRVVYKSMPDDDPITSALLKSVMRGIDEWHSLTSKRKGLAGMAENVRQGFRAGGRAPRGYRLVALQTGAIREGVAVTKTKLELDDSAPLIAEYLQLRANGAKRSALVRQLKISWPATSLIGMEWNALTYAGHTVWNVHSELLPDGGYKGRTKRRPRSEWIIQRETHQALISDAVAETLLDQLEKLDRGGSREQQAVHLLSGLLRTPEGIPWHGNRASATQFYRAKAPWGTRNIAGSTVDRAVVKQVAIDLQSGSFVAGALKATRAKFAVVHSEQIAVARAKIANIDSRISRLLDVASQLATPAPVLRKVDEFERERATIAQQIVSWQVDDEAAEVLANITDSQIRTMLRNMAQEMQTYPQQELRDFLSSILERIELDPATETLQLCYRIPLRSGNSMASPGGSRSTHPIRWVVDCALRPKRAA
jgi:site-specific DNA recombinase